MSSPTGRGRRRDDAVPRLLRFLSSQLWRLRRREAARRTESANAGGIERYLLFAGQLQIRGAMAVPGPVTELVLETAAGDAVPVPFQPEPGRVRFDAILPVRADPSEAASGRLVARLRDGGEHCLDQLGTATDDPAHGLSAQFQALMRERPQGRLLEVGSRARSGVIRRDWTPACWEYSGFDILPGANVDVVGDAHALSRHYPPAQFDAVMAFSVLEHMLMPWKFVVELNRVLKPGGVGLFTTHQCWPLHDQPWDFWRFSDAAWTGLLNPATGFEIIAARMGEPAYIVAQRCSPSTAFAEHPAGALASFVLFRKTGETALDWPVELGDILATRYPADEVG